MLNNSVARYEASKILEEIEQRYSDTEDITIKEKIIKLELLAGDGRYGEEGHYPQLYRVLASSPKLYLEYIQHFYFGNKKFSDDYNEKLNSLFFNPKFAPGLIDGSFAETVFSGWVREFKRTLSLYDGWANFFYNTLGKLFSNYPNDIDELPLPISVREFIETVKGKKQIKDLAVGYLIGESNFRVRTIRDGKDLFEKAKKYKSYSDELLKNGYKNTSFIFTYLADYYLKQARIEREAAIDG